MAWHHVDHPSEVIKKGDMVRVVVLSIENEGDRISLSRREILPDPWKEAQGMFAVGQTLPVEIVRMVSTGAFAKLPGLEVEGFIPLREMSYDRIKKPEDALQLGQKVEAKVLDMQPAARKMTLSIVATMPRPERAPSQPRVQQQRSEPERTGINLGEHFGDILRGALAEEAPAAPEPAAAPEPEEAQAEEAVVAEPKVRKPRAKKPKAEEVEAPAEEVAAEPEAEAAVEPEAEVEAEAEVAAEAEPEAPAEAPAEEA
jgi:ribosomal protein S1